MAARLADRELQAGGSNAQKSATLQSWFIPIARFSYGLLTGLLLSGILLLPTIAAMRTSSRGFLEWGKLLDISFHGNLLSVIENYRLGAKSALGSVSLYCGSLALLGCLGSLQQRQSRRRRRLMIALGVGTLFFFYWNPLYVSFSLFKSVGSYWYRFSYLGSFTIIYLAAHFYLTATTSEVTKFLPRTALLFAGLLLLCQYIKGGEQLQLVYATAVLLSAFVVFGAALFSHLKHDLTLQPGGQMTGKILYTLFSMLFCLETSLNASYQMNNYHAHNAKVFQNYARAATQQLTALQTYDPSTYRISQTYGRNHHDNNLTANYNEAMAYNYWSINSYTSSPDDVTSLFLSRLGYLKMGSNMCIVNTSLLAADALLGVKYILSPYPIHGLQSLSQLPVNAVKMAVYRNPYSLPLAFTYPATGYVARAVPNNPFEQTNEWYSQLLGQPVQLYRPLHYTLENRPDGSRRYLITLPPNASVIYGNLPWTTQFKGTLQVNNRYKTAYACWLSPSVFHIPTEPDDQSCQVVVTANQPGQPIKLRDQQEQFYALDLQQLAAATAQLQAQAVERLEMRNGHLRLQVTTDTPKRLFISIPYNRGWTITDNGQLLQPTLFGVCLYTLRLAPGPHTIEMVYQPPYVTLGIGASLMGLVMLLGTEVARRRQR